MGYRFVKQEGALRFTFFERDSFWLVVDNYKPRFIDDVLWVREDGNPEYVFVCKAESQKHAFMIAMALNECYMEDR